MLINWFTVIAQIVNFLVLVFLLKYFLYDRVLKAMDEREERIHLRLKEAEEKKEEAEQEAETFRARNRDFDEKHEEMLARAKEEADARRKELMKEARRAATQVRSMWIKSIERDKGSFIRDLRKMAGSHLYAVARRALGDLADAGLEERTIEMFLTQIRTINKKKREALVASVRKAGGEVIVRSALEIPAKLRHKITQALRQQIADGIEVHYDTASDLIMGIELRAGDRKIAWNVQHYLDSLEENILQALEREAQRKTAGQEAVLLAEQDEGKGVTGSLETDGGMPEQGQRTGVEAEDESATS